MRIKIKTETMMRRDESDGKYPKDELRIGSRDLSSPVRKRLIR